MIPRVTIALSQFVKPVATGKSPGGSVLGVGAGGSQSGQNSQDAAPDSSGSPGGQSGQQADFSNSNNKHNNDNKENDGKQTSEVNLNSDLTVKGSPQGEAAKFKNLRLVSPTERDESEEQESISRDAGQGETPILPPIPEGQSVSHTFFQLFESIQKTRNQVAGWLGNRVYLGPGKSGAKSKGRFKKGSMLDHKAS